MSTDNEIRAILPKELVIEMERVAIVKTFEKGTEILKEEQYIKVLPIVQKGLVKVYSRFDEKELLLYYIEPSQSCVMSFYAALSNAPSKVYAITEEDTELLLLPVEYLGKWLRSYPDFNELFYSQYNQRYTELLDTIRHLLLNTMDKRLYEHLKKKTELLHDTIRMTHSQIANELGTSREVITRVLKKLEAEEKILQTKDGVKIL